MYNLEQVNQNGALLGEVLCTIRSRCNSPKVVDMAAKLYAHSRTTGRKIGFSCESSEPYISYAKDGVRADDLTRRTVLLAGRYVQKYVDTDVTDEEAQAFNEAICMVVSGAKYVLVDLKLREDEEEELR